jgi:two-component system, response regulator PdtaR
MTTQVAACKARGAAGPPVILVVEDEPLLRSITGEYLRLCGYVVIEATDAAEAIAIIGRRARVDVVFSDVSLPGTVDGLSLARWLRRGQPGLRVMLTSGYGSTVRGAAIEIVGSDGFVPKPYHQEELVSRIDDLLGKGRGSTRL